MFSESGSGQSWPCRQKCRAEGFKIHLSKETEDNSCYCSNSGLQTLQSCDNNTLQFNTAGLGFPLLSYQVQPDGYTSHLKTIKDSSFIEVSKAWLASHHFTISV